MTDNELSRLCLEYRAANRLTQAQMAEFCGVSRPIIGKLEAGKELTEFTKLKIKFAIEKGAENETEN